MTEYVKRIGHDPTQTGMDDITINLDFLLAVIKIGANAFAGDGRADKQVELMSSPSFMANYLCLWLSIIQRRAFIRGFCQF